MSSYFWAESLVDGKIVRVLVCLAVTKKQKCPPYGSTQQTWMDGVNTTAWGRCEKCR